MSKGNKKPKDINAPKRNLSSYFIFSNERRAVLLQQQTEKKDVTVISKTISAEWKSMDGSTKKTYENKAAEQKKEYLLKFEEYKKTDEYGLYQKKLSEWKEREFALGRIGKGSKSAKGVKPPTKPKQPKAMPKRPMSAYFIFSNGRRNEVRAQFPDKKLTDVTKVMAEEWKSKTADEKKIYEEKFKILKEKYTIEFAEYKKTEEYKNYQQSVNAWKNAKKVSLPRKPKDIKCPKRPLTSYFIYAKQVREDTKKEFPNISITDIAKEISKKWKLLTQDEKKPYVAQAAVLKEEYKKVLAEYEGSEAQIEFKKKLEQWKVDCDRKKEMAKPKVSPKKRMKSPKKHKKMQQRMQESSSDESSSDSDSDSDSDSSNSYSSDSSSDSSSE